MTHDGSALMSVESRVVALRFAVTGEPSIQTYGVDDFAWAVRLSITFSFD
jgi:hypothetical protein